MIRYCPYHPKHRMSKGDAQNPIHCTECDKEFVMAMRTIRNAFITNAGEFWFHFWVDRSEDITHLQNIVLMKPHVPRRRAEAEIRLWTAERLSWVYHRCLDIAALVLEPE